MARKWQSTEENVLLYVVREIDLDDLTRQHEDRLRQTMEAVGKLAGQFVAGEVKALAGSQQLGTAGVAVIQLQARLEVLKELKAKITANPPAARVQGREIEPWLDADGPSTEYAFQTAYIALAANKLIRKWPMPKRNSCRYKFMGQPENHPREYSIFRRMALHKGVILYDKQTSFVFSWDFRRPAIVARGTPTPAGQEASSTGGTASSP